MTEHYQRFLDAGAEVVAIVNDSLDAARSYFEKHDIPFPCLTDPHHAVYDLYQVESRAVSLGQRPGLLVIDREGRVGYAYIGWQQWEIPSPSHILEVCRALPCLGQ